MRLSALLLVPTLALFLLLNACGGGGASPQRDLPGGDPTITGGECPERRPETVALSDQAFATLQDIETWDREWWDKGRLSACGPDRLQAEFDQSAADRTEEVGYWTWSRYFTALGTMLDLTRHSAGDQRERRSAYMARWRELNDVLYKNRGIFDEVRGRDVPAWGTRWWNGSMTAEVAVNGIYAHSLAWFARIVSQDAEFQAEHGQAAVDYLTYVMGVIEFFDENAHVENDTLYYVEPASLREQDCAGDPKCERAQVYAGRPLPFNIVHTLGRAMLEVHGALGVPFYANHDSRDDALRARHLHETPLRLSRMVRRLLSRTPAPYRHLVEETADGESIYVWRYREYDYDDNEKTPSNFEDASHGEVTADFLSRVFDGIPLLDPYLASGSKIDLGPEDMRRFARAFVLKLWQGGPNIRENVAGEFPHPDETYRYNTVAQGWLGLARFDPRLYGACEQITLLGSNGNQPYLQVQNHAALLYNKFYRFKNLQVSRHGTTPWRAVRQTDASIHELGVGDFDGDGVLELFRARDGRWDVAWLSGGDWETINTSGIAMSHLHLHDFDANGITDVFRSTDERWYVSWDSRSSWTDIGSSDEDPATLRFGDFDGDGCADIFRLNGRTWQVSFGSRSRSFSFWTDIGSSEEPLAGLLFGDFDGNGITDIFRISGTDWHVAFGALDDNGTYLGHAPWRWVGSSSAPLRELRLGDLDGDGSTDILQVRADEWLASYGDASQKLSGWESLNTEAPSGEAPENLLIARLWSGEKDSIFRIADHSRIDPVK